MNSIIIYYCVIRDKASLENIAKTCSAILYIKYTDTRTSLIIHLFSNLVSTQQKWYVGPTSHALLDITNHTDVQSQNAVNAHF